MNKCDARHGWAHTPALRPIWVSPMTARFCLLSWNVHQQKQRPPALQPTPKGGQAKRIVAHGVLWFLPLVSFGLIASFVGVFVILIRFVMDTLFFLSPLCISRSNSDMSSPSLLACKQNKEVQRKR